MWAPREGEGSMSPVIPVLNTLLSLINLASSAATFVNDSQQIIFIHLDRVVTVYLTTELDNTVLKHKQNK